MTEPAPNPAEPAGAVARAADVPTGAVPNRDELKEQMRRQMLAGLGGWSGMAVAAAPTVVFVAVNALTSLRPAVAAAIGTAVLLMGYRLARHQPVQQVANGLFGVIIAAAIAARTGQARGYFLVGIWASFLYGAVFLVSILVRRPLIGVVWEFLDPTPPPAAQRADDSPVGSPHADLAEAPMTAAAGAPAGGNSAGERETPWHRRPALARAYLLATATATAIFALRAVVQLSLFRQNATGWLAVARIAMGYPLTFAALGFAYLIVRRARSRLLADGL